MFVSAHDRAGRVSRASALDGGHAERLAAMSLSDYLPTGQPTWSGVCSGLEGDPVQEAIAQRMIMSPQPARDVPAGQGPLVFTCDWCRRRVDRSLNLRDHGAGLRGDVVPISTGEGCCMGMCWHVDGDEIELCCLCYRVPDPGTRRRSTRNPCCCGATSHVRMRRRIRRAYPP